MTMGSEGRGRAGIMVAREASSHCGRFTFFIMSGQRRSDRPRYRILQKLGQGAFSTVWLAQDMADHKYVVFSKHLFGTDHWQPLLAAASLSKSPPQTSRTMTYLSESGVIHGGASCHVISWRYSTYLPSRSACRQYNVFVPWTSRAYHGSLDRYSWISLFSSCCSSEFRGTKWLYPNTWWRPPKSRMLWSPFWTNTEKKASMQ